MDQFSAHLDRGWDLVQKGDSKGAEVSARRALEIDGQSPEAYNLLGYVCALEGDFDEAVETYRQAIALDDTYLEAMLNVAEIYIHPLGEYQDAIDMCDRALDLAETDEERVDALLLKFDALLGMNESDAARRLCLTFPEGPYDNPNHAFLVGRALFEAGELSRAAPLIEEATRAHPRNAEAHYYLGLLRDEQGEIPSAVDSFLRSRQLDLELPPPSWSLSPAAFAQAVQNALASLPDELTSGLVLEDVYVADLPGIEVIVDGVDPRALLIVDTLDSGGDKPQARLFVYQRNIERLAGAVEMIEAELRSALERELAATVSPDEALDPDDVADRILN